VVVARSNLKRKNTDIHCVIEKYLRKNMKNLTGFVGVVKEADSTKIFLRQRVFRRFDNCEFLFKFSRKVME